MADFKTFMSLTDAHVAEEFASILEINKIPFKIQDTAKDFDASFSNNKATQSIIIMLNPKDFDKATQVLDVVFELDTTEINDEHPMYKFNNEELLDVIKNAEEWHPLDVKLAKELLKNNEVSIDEEEILKFKKEKTIESQKPEKCDKTTLLIGYVFSIPGGLIGFFIALFLITSKKTLPSGEKIYTYTQSDRNHGYRMLTISIIVIIICLVIVFKN